MSAIDMHRQDTPCGEFLVENAVQAPRFFVKALDGVGDFFLQAIKIIRLAEHRPNAAHLKHEPLNHGVALAHVSGPELAGFFREVKQNGARFE